MLNGLFHRLLNGFAASGLHMRVLILIGAAKPCAEFTGTYPTEAGQGTTRSAIGCNVICCPRRRPVSRKAGFTMGCMR